MESEDKELHGAASGIDLDKGTSKGGGKRGAE